MVKMSHNNIIDPTPSILLFFAHHAMTNEDAFYIILLEKWYEFRTLLFFNADHKIDSYLCVVLIFNVTTFENFSGI